ncbi:hypothetical protein AX17_006656 [Amanita inopinata Kibby_2008]|nr:hypothetical protein AX17_006656 [Amanita inopinata Kibby_2008]
MSNSLRVAVLQFRPKIGQVQVNIARARELCSKLQPRSVDLVCFPEMAFTGYVFENSAAIKPYLEKPRLGPTSSFCSELAKRLQCYVVAGYPETLPQDELADERSTALDGLKSGPNIHCLVGANSAVVFGPDGEWISNYRKTNLFETDLTWAKAGTGFVTFKLPAPLGNVTLGICMDLNPQTSAWSLENGPYELAEYCLSKGTNTLIMVNAWLDSGNMEVEEHDLQTVRYWVARLRPLWANDQRSSNSVPVPKHVEKRDVIVVVCNRIGEENEKTFAGSSAVFRMKPGSGRPRVLDMLTRNEELLQVWDIKI